jgi:hypothetical protein
VTDYGVRLTVRVGILSQLACAPFKVVLLYSLALRGGQFHRPFQVLSAPRYVSTAGGPVDVQLNSEVSHSSLRAGIPRKFYNRP